MLPRSPHFISMSISRAVISSFLLLAVSFYFYAHYTSNAAVNGVITSSIFYPEDPSSQTAQPDGHGQIAQQQPCPLVSPQLSKLSNLMLQLHFYYSAQFVNYQLNSWMDKLVLGGDGRHPSRGSSDSRIEDGSGRIENGRKVSAGGLSFAAQSGHRRSGARPERSFDRVPALHASVPPAEATGLHHHRRPTVWYYCKIYHSNFKWLMSYF